MNVGKLLVAFNIKDPLHFNLSEAALRLSEVAKIEDFEYGRAGFVGNDYSFCVFYNQPPNRFELTWFYIKQAYKYLIYGKTS